MGGPYGHMLSEISQTEKDKRHMILLIKWNLKKQKIKLLVQKTVLVARREG